MTTPYLINARLNLTTPVKEVQKLRAKLESQLSNINVGFNAKSILSQTQQIGKSVDQAAKKGGNFSTVFADLNKTMAPVQKRMGALTENMRRFQGVASQVKQAQDKVSQTFSNVGRTTKTNTQNLKQLNNKTKQLAKETKGVTKSVNRADQALGGHNTSILNTVRSYARMSIGIFSVFTTLRKFNDVLRQNIDLLHEQINLAQISGSKVYAPAPKEIMGNVRSTATKYGGDISQLAGATAMLEQSGISTNKNIIEMLGKLNVNKQILQLTKISELMVTLQKVWGKSSAREVQNFFNSLLTASKETSAEVEGLAEGANILSNAFSQMGMSTNFMLASLAQTKQATQQPMSRIARGLLMMSSRIMSGPHIQSELSDLGVETHTLENGIYQLRDLTQILQDAKAEIEKYGAKSKRGGNIIEALFGNRRRNIGLGYIKMLDIIMAQKERLDKGGGTDQIGKDALIYADSLIGKLSKLDNKITNLGKSIANISFIKTLTDMFLSMANAVSTLTSNFTELLPLIAMLGASRFMTKGLGNVPLIGKNAKKLGPRRALGKSPLTPDPGMVRHRERLLKANSQLLRSKYSHIDAVQREQWARQISAQEIKNNVKSWVRLDGTVTKLTRTQRGLIKAQMAARRGIGMAKRYGFGAGVVGLAMHSQLADTEQPVHRGIQAGGQIALLGILTKLNFWITAISSATVAIKSWSDALIKSKEVLGAKEFREASQDVTRQLQAKDLEEAKRAKNLKFEEVRKARKRTKLGATDIGIMEDFAYKMEFGWGVGESIKGFKETNAKAYHNMQDQLLAQLQKDTDTTIELYGAQTLEEFKRVAPIQYLETSKVRKGYDKYIIDRIEALQEGQVEQKPILTRKTSPFDYLKRQQFGAGSIERLGSPKYFEEVKNMPGVDTSQAVDMGRIKNLLPKMLENIIDKDTGVNQNILGKLLKEHMDRAGIGKDVSSALINFLEQNMSDLNFDNINDASNKLVQGALEPHYSEIVRINEELQTMRESLADTTSELRQRQSSMISSANKYSQAQLNILQRRSDSPTPGMADLFTRRRAENIAGTASVGKLSDRLSKLTGAMQKAQEAGHVGVEEAYKLKINETVSALELLGKTSNRVSDYMSELAQEERRRLNKENIVRSFLTSSMSEKLKMRRGFMATNLVSRGADIQSFTRELRQSIISTLESLGTTRTNITGGRRADKVLDEVYSQFLGPRKERDRLEGKIRGIEDDSLSAIKTMADHQQSLHDKFFSKLDSRITRLLSGIDKWVGGGAEPAKKFASGGLVPGFGNFDKVLSWLTPGELVIPKDKLKEIESKYSPAKMAQIRNEREKRIMQKYNPEKMLEAKKAREKRIGEKYADMTPSDTLSLSGRGSTKNTLNFAEKLLAQRKASRIASGGGGENILDTGLHFIGNALNREPKIYNREKDKIRRGATSEVTETALKTATTSGPGATADMAGLDKLASHLPGFISACNNLAEKLPHIPESIEITGNVKTEVIHNGLNFLKVMNPKIQRLVTSEINKSINNLLKERFPDLRPLD